MQRQSRVSPDRSKSRPGPLDVLAVSALVAAGLAGHASPRALAAPGDPDLTFAGTGKVLTDFTGGGDAAYGVAVQRDGKIVVVGGSQGNFALARYLANGDPDPSFGGGDGRVTTDFGGDGGLAWSVAIQADGRIVAAGETDPVNGQDFAVARYMADGSPDPSFGGGDGQVTTDFGGDDDIAFAVAVRKDGRIVVAGIANPGGHYDVAVARYKADGTPDPSFGGGDGKVTTDFGGEDDGYAIALVKGNKILVAGDSDASGSNDYALARYNNDGSLDPTFSGGKVTTVRDGNQTAYGVAVQKNGRIVIAGESGTGDFGLARYKSNGSLDSSFGMDGTVATDLGGFDSARAIVFQKNRRIVVAGYRNIPGATDFALARYLANGKIDPSFGNGGGVLTNFGGAVDEAHALAIQRNGRLVAAGYSNAGSSFDFAVARYLAR